jgi:YggT family protein
VIVFASARTEIADFLSALLLVYTLCIVGYVVMQLVFSLGARIPYSRWSRAIMDFLSEVSEPFLRIFRRLGLQIGPLDLSPMVAILVLQLLGGLIVDLIRG